MTQTIAQALKQARFYSDGAIYQLVKLPPTAITLAAGVIAEIGLPFSALIVDKDEISLIAVKEALDEFSTRLRGQEIAKIRYRLITIDVVLEPTLTGFIALIGAALAAEKISILPLAAYSRDHLLVPETQFETAIKALEKLKSDYLR